MSFIPGEHVGPYIIQEQLGKGGMATVFKAFHPTLERYVAIKVIDAGLAKQQDFLTRFKREARIIARLENPHIVPVFGFDEHDGQPYLVLKLVDGQTLRERMKKLPLTHAEILDVVVAVGDGLQYAHDCGVLHRDIKPSNILLARDGRIYISDFGLARIAESTSNLTGDRILGTPHYISPEQALNAEKLDEGTDIYSFGIMLYEMVVGRLPYDSKTPITIIEDHIYTPPPPPRSLKPELSPEVESAILKALEKKRCDRFDKVASLVQVFQAAWTYDANQRTLTSGRPETVRRAVLSGPEGVSFPLAAEKVVLGRNSATGAVHNDIDLSSLDVRKIVSRRHAMVERRGDEYTISDLGSRNGTFLNGERLPAHQPRPLASGDVIEFGTGGVELTFKR